MADRYWVGGAGTWDTSSTTVWSTSSGGASGASVPTATDNVFFDVGSGVPGTVTLTGALTCLNINVSLIGWTFASTGTIAISGNMSLTALTTWTGTGTLTFNSTATGKTITTSGTTFSCAIVFDGAGGGWTLGGAFTTTSTATLTAGAFAYSNYTFTCTTWSSSNVNTRSIDGTGTGEIVVTNSSGTVVDMATQTGMTTTGHPDFHSLSNSGATPTVSMGVPTEANTCSVIIEQGGAGGSSLTSGDSIYNITVTDGSVGGLAQTIYGDVYLGSSADSTAVQSANVTWTMARTSGTSTLTGNGKVAGVNFDINCPGGTVQLADAFAATSRTLSLTSGTLNLNSQVFSAFRLQADNTGTRTLAFGASGRIDGAIDDSNNTVCTINPTNLTITGTPVIKSTYSGANGVTFTMGAPTEGNSISLLAGNNTGGTVVTGRVKNITFTAAYAGAFTTGGVTYYGNLILVSTMSTVASASAVTFAATSSKTITTAGVTLNFPVTFNGVAGTWTLQDALTVGSTRTTTLTAGTLGLSSYTLTTGLFASSGSTARTLAFGTGNITLSAATAVTMWNTATVTNLTISGTPVVNATGGGAVAKTISAGALAAASTISFNLQCSAGTVAFTAANAIKNLTLNGAFTLSNIAISIYGNYTYTASTTLTAGANAWTFASTGSQTINSGATTLDFPITFNGAGGTWALGAGLTVGSTRLTTLTNGTLSLAGFTYSTGTFATATGTKNITFNAGTLTVVGSGATTFNNAQPTNFTTTAGTGTGTIYMSSGGLQTFVGGGSTFNCELSVRGSSGTDAGGGAGNIYQAGAPTAGTVNTGGGGGGSGNAGSVGTPVNGAAGGSGLVVVRYLTSSLTANGGTITTDGSYTVHTFTASGTFQVTVGSGSVWYLVVAGGGGGGKQGGGGGAGGLLTNGAYTYAVTVASYTVTVGLGGAGGTGVYPAQGWGVTGANSVFDTITASGGGGGGGAGTSPSSSRVGLAGGSGGGSGTDGADAVGGAGIVGQGFAGGRPSAAANYGAGGGGGAGGPGSNGSTTHGGNGGLGLTSAISGTSTLYAGGGGGGVYLSGTAAGNTYYPALTITGSSTLANIRNTTQPVSVLFTAGTTTTFTSGFSLSGTAGNLVTIGSVTAASHTLSKASGTVDVSYCSISRSTATGGATWLAYV